MHFSVSSVGSVHTEPSSGNCFTYLSRDRMPMPQEMLQGDQVIHSDMVQVEPSVTHRADAAVRVPPARGRARHDPPPKSRNQKGTSWLSQGFRQLRMEENIKGIV